MHCVRARGENEERLWKLRAATAGFSNSGIFKDQ